MKDAVLHAHPEFLPQAGGETPELVGMGADGAWKRISNQPGDNFLSHASRPAGGWALRFPKAGLRLENYFDPTQVETCLFYNGKTFFNLELFSPGARSGPRRQPQPSSPLRGRGHPAMSAIEVAGAR